MKTIVLTFKIINYSVAFPKHILIVCSLNNTKVYLIALSLLGTPYKTIFGPYKTTDVGLIF